VGLLGTVEISSAQAILATIASSMITVAGVAFSITVVALQLASTQFGPRLLRTFLVDTGNQIVLGAFISTFLYCLIVLGALRGGEDEFVPHYAFSLGVLLGLANVGVLIFFVHHVASEVRVENVIESLASELYGSTDELFRVDRDDAQEADQAAHELAAPAQAPDALDIPAAADGYIRHVNEAELIALAAEHDLLIRLTRRPGDFVIDADILLSVSPRHGADEVAERLRDCIVLGPTRTPLQDPVFAQQQLVEVGVRALSAAFNDPFTATACIDRLGQGLCRFARRKPLSPYRHDDAGKIRVVLRPVTLAEMASAAFEPIARSGRAHLDVTLSLLRALLLVAGCARSPDDREFLIGLARHIRADAGEVLVSARDREALAAAFNELIARFHAEGSLTGAAAPPTRVAEQVR